MFAAECALSLDVIYHLVEDEVFEAYMSHVFDAATRYVVVYSSNKLTGYTAPHVRHRVFTDWVERNAPEWRLERHVPNEHGFAAAQFGETSHAEFYIFSKEPAPDAAAG